MGTGLHGGFGFTYGFKNLAASFKIGRTSVSFQNLTKDDLVRELENITKESSEIANAIRNKNIKVSFLGDEVFEKILGGRENDIALCRGNNIYLRKSSGSIYSDAVHEGTHAMDNLKGINQTQIKAEIHAFTTEHFFQKAKGMTLDLENEDEILVYVITNYKGEK